MRDLGVVGRGVCAVGVDGWCMNGGMDGWLGGR